MPDLRLVLLNVLRYKTDFLHPLNVVRQDIFSLFKRMPSTSSLNFTLQDSFLSFNTLHDETAKSDIRKYRLHLYTLQSARHSHQTVKPAVARPVGASERCNNYSLTRSGILVTWCLQLQDAECMGGLGIGTVTGRLQ